ncbi:YdeI/OmpD-associated family protein [Leptolyngbya sp. KIOST-1]|uniref:YdeI/OmpD-associated family protein n=1 Tax=Leptolyngbya sp. KIOST-1 TaxID=1229172 RepID=UPI00055F6044|nr:YdeI/OmpD-associated family protein [Leptolyngbya sp. KIOST-1]
MIKTENFAQVEVSSVQQLRQWLEENHTQTDSIWLVTYKKHMGAKYVSVQDILDEVLCFGWVDGIRRQLDEDRTMQMISPRQAQHWAKSYKDRAEKLIQAGKMHSAGLEAIAASKRNGLWNLMDDVDALILPVDLVEAMESHPPAKEIFENSAPSYRRNVLRWIKLAKTTKTRTQRIEKAAIFAAQNKKIPQM